MTQPVCPRGRDEPWERILYPLLLVVAVVVIFYSLFGIAALLGYLPLPRNAGAGKEIQHPAVGARPSADRVRSTVCPGGNGVKRAVLVPSPGAAPGLACADSELERHRARSAAAPAPSKDLGRFAEDTPTIGR